MDFGEYIGIKQVMVSKHRVELELLVTDQVKQPFGYLHGGVSVALAEHAASLGAGENIEKNQVVFGQEINANHIKSVEQGFVHAEATPMHIGRSTQVWQIRITNDAGELICISRCTVAVRTKRIK
ncbi:1,4-dihydroxy-2-naphthoyl-CoA hydrolase MenI [Listeria kieliensis]|uniref:Thioesterase n=1 Tax=Listeria kieliensis TaxID=1621700 RepID=A0A3D8TLN5_9LIST|nr:hotdog fold thioesterase [Listeria kieliensis]RDW99431.1 thioesterase [Listeria kieliensis]